MSDAARLDKVLETAKRWQALARSPNYSDEPAVSAEEVLHLLIETLEALAAPGGQP